MNDFDYDVKEKKKIARSARAVKRGSRSRKCSLPCDHMTPAEWKRRNGEVSTYQLGGPMSWAEFKKLPKDLQKQYIENLQREYRANFPAIAAMFGVSLTALRRRTEELVIKAPTGGAARMSADDRERWDAFVNPAEPAENICEPAPPAPAEKETPAGAVLRSGQMTFRGPVGDAMRQVYAILGETSARCTITWEIEEAKE